MSNLVECSAVHVRNDKYGGAGVFAARDIRNGEIVEIGIARRLTNVDGNENPFIFTWSDEVPNKTWALCSGSATFYNTCADDAANVHMIRYFDEDRFEIVATRDIAKDEELVHVYKGKNTRKCFECLRDKPE